MNKTTNKEILKSFPIFMYLDDKDLETLSSNSIEKSYYKDDIIFYQNELGKKLCLILSGSVKICIFSPDGKEHTLGNLSEKEFFGELSVLDGENRSTSAVAIDDVKLIIIDRNIFLEILKKNPYIVYHIILALCKRIRWTDKHLNTLAFLSSHGKVAKLLLDMAKEKGKKIGNNIFITHKLTRQEMANIVGTSRETLTRIIIEYQNEKIIETKKNQIIILNEEKLKEKIFDISNTK
jgi:CRP-like cAMP-binding protein